MSGKYSRNKGRRAEQELVNILKSSGIPAKRISMQETGRIDKGDIELAECWKGEVKDGIHVPTWLYNARKEGEQFLFCKRDRKDWLIVMDLDFFLSKFI